MTLDGHIKTGLTSSLVFLGTYQSWLSENWSQTSIMIAAILIFIGNLAPDFMEMKVIRHRTYTHFPWYYLIIGGLAYFLGLSGSNLAPSGFDWWSPQWSFYIVAFCFGCLTHISADWPYYGGIPLFTPKRKIPLAGITFESPANRVIEYSVVAFGMGCLWFYGVTAAA